MHEAAKTVGLHGWPLAAWIIGALLAGALILALLTAVPPKYRKPIVMAATFIAGLYYALEFLVPPFVWVKTEGQWEHVNPLSNYRAVVGSLVQVVSGFAILLGITNLVQIHGRSIAKRTSGWYNSAAFFIAFVAMMVIGFAFTSYPKNELAASTYRIVFGGFLVSLDSTVFSLIAFYIASAAYRAFRIKSAEPALMMIAAAIVMLAIVPAGAMMTAWLPKTGFWSSFRLENIGQWLLWVPNMSAQRAIAFGIAVGALAMGLRIWLSLERGSYFDRQL